MCKKITYRVLYLPCGHKDEETKLEKHRDPPCDNPTKENGKDTMRDTLCPWCKDDLEQNKKPKKGPMAR